MTEPIRKSFAHQLEDLEKDLTELWASVETTIEQAVKSLIDRDATLAGRIIAADDAIDEKELAIDGECMRLLALQQPMATDLRLIGSISKIVTDVERVADHATKVAEKAAILASKPPLKPYVDLPLMAEKVVEMLRRSREAFTKRDEHLARAVISLDDEIDFYNRKIFEELVGLMIQNPARISEMTHLLTVVHSIERIGDHVTNMCERIIYMITGTLPKLN
jgi:phosphate transport system protein